MNGVTREDILKNGYTRGKGVVNKIENVVVDVHIIQINVHTQSWLF